MNKNEQKTYPEILLEKLAPAQEPGRYGIEKQAILNDIATELDNPIVARSVSAAVAELARAERIYPELPDDTVHAVSVMAEEAGEAVRAANNLKWGHHRGTTAEAVEKLRTELIQTAAMCFRMLKHMPERSAR